MKIFLFIILTFQLLLISCSKVRESAGVTRKSLDEFEVIENPPLVIPPNFNLLPPEQLEKKNIQNVEKELAEEILFGLDENIENNQENISTMNQIIDSAAGNKVDPKIRTTIDEDFAGEVNSKGFFEKKWENDKEILNAIEESERIRKLILEGKKLSEESEIIIEDSIEKKEEPKQKKKKRFFFF